MSYLKQTVKSKYKELRSEGLLKMQAIRQLSEDYGKGVTTVWEWISEEPEYSDEIVTKLSKDVARAHATRSYSVRQLGVLRKEVEELRETVENLTQEFEVDLKSEFIEKDSSVGCTVIALASDWHVGEGVTKEQVNYINEYNPTIAKERAYTFFTEIKKKIESLQNEKVVDRLIIWLGGDFITGDIHAVTRDTNELTPEEEILLAYELLSEGLEYLDDSLNIPEMNVVCNIGNHGRTTIKMYERDAFKYNREFTMYHQLARTLRDSSWQFLIPRSYDITVPVYGKKVRFSHGDFINCKSLANLDGAVSSHINTSNIIEKVDFDILGHYHRLTSTEYYCVNGSLIGYNTYGKRIGVRPEPPQQALIVVDSDGVIRNICKITV
jgi:hypothetical protein